jgi:Ca2+-binding RTX toxin-like protein
MNTLTQLENKPIRATLDRNGELEVRGDSTPNEITVGRDGDGTILVNNGTVAVTGGVATVANTTEISVIGRGSDDVLRVQNGDVMPHVTLDGGAGNDTLIGGNGNDTLIGGSGNDTVFGGRGTDTAHLGSGDDSFVWNPGDGNDVVTGGSGSDRLFFNGANIAETVELSDASGHVIFTRDVAGITMDLDGMETIDFTARGGADLITVHDLTHTDAQRVNIDLGAIPGTPGTPGNPGDGVADTVLLEGGTRGTTINVQTLAGDTVVTGLGTEVHITGADAGIDVVDQLAISAGAGNDTINASQLTGMDLAVDGGDGNDRMLFDGSGSDENLDISANGTDARFFRGLGNPTVSLAGIETLDVNAAAGADTIVVNDLTGTDVNTVNLDLAGDGVADAVTVSGTNIDDTVAVSTVRGETRVTGLAAEVRVDGADGGQDRLVINTLSGNDVIDASKADPHGMLLAINSGAGNDVITGSAGDDAINGGSGTDTAFMGDGNDTFVWNPGEGSDIVEGQAGNDTMLFNGALIAEEMDISANGDRSRMTRNVGTVTMDMDGVETIGVTARGGADKITVHDMTGTDVTLVDIDLAGTPGQDPGQGDGATDSIFVEGTAGNDVIRLSVQDGVLVIDGLATQVRIHDFQTGDEIHIAGLGGDDIIDAAEMPADGPLLILDGGDGDDIVIGGAGDDRLLGGAGDDVLQGGPGLDALDGGSGDNVLFQ